MATLRRFHRHVPVAPRGKKVKLSDYDPAWGPAIRTCPGRNARNSLATLSDDLARFGRRKTGFYAARHLVRPLRPASPWNAGPARKHTSKHVMGRRQSPKGLHVRLLPSSPLMKSWDHNFLWRYGQDTPPERGPALGHLQSRLFSRKSSSRGRAPRADRGRAVPERKTDRVFGRGRY